MSIDNPDFSAPLSIQRSSKSQPVSSRPSHRSVLTPIADSNLRRSRPNSPPEDTSATRPLQERKFRASSGQRRRPDFLPAHKRQRRREAPQREHHVAGARAQLLGGFTVGGHELCIKASELAAHDLAGGMEGRRGRLLRSLGLPQRILGKDGGRPQRLGARPLSPGHRNRCQPSSRVPRIQPPQDSGRGSSTCYNWL